IKTVRYTETPRQFDRLAARDQSRSLAILQRRNNHRSRADTEMHIALLFAVCDTRLTKSLDHVQRYAHCFVAVVRVRFRKTKERDHSLGIGSLNVRARLHEDIRRSANKLFRQLAEHWRLTVFRQI